MEKFRERNNSELVNIFGNFVNRTLVLTKKYYDKVVPSPGECSDEDKTILAEIGNIKKSLEENTENYRFREALKDLMNLSRMGNKYLAEQQTLEPIQNQSQANSKPFFIRLSK